MLETLKKILGLALAIAILLLLLYIAFYLFLIALVFILGITLYLKWKGVNLHNLHRKPPHYWWQQHKKPHPGDTGKTVIIESTEYEEITPEDKPKPKL